MAKIQNAKALPEFEWDNYILAGPAGGGKSTLAATLPGKTLVKCFDISGFAAYAKAARYTNHIDIQTYIVQKRDLTPYTTADNKKGAAAYNTPGLTKETGDLYFEFARDITNEVKNGDLPGEYANLIIDSGTTLQMLVMDAILAKEGRPGQVPIISDYGTQMNLFGKICDQIFALPMNAVLLLHDEFVQDTETSRFQYQLMLTGKMKGRIPTKVSHLIRCTAEGNINTGTTYYIQTVPDRYSESIRTSFNSLSPKHDVTIKDFSKIQSYGLGAIIAAQKESLTPSGTQK